MEDSKIQNILVKFINNEADIAELELLESWLSNPKNITLFNRFVEIDYLTLGNMKEYNLDKAKVEVSKKIKANKRQKNLALLKKVSVAASIIFATGLGYVLLNNGENETQEVVVEPIIDIQAISPGTNKAILTLGDGSEISLSKDETYSSEYVTSDGETLTYNDQDTNSGTNDLIEYNVLTIPRGGEYFVVLSDGTKVWLNSDSKLRYPTKFAVGGERQIELIYGEAYLEVSPSSSHQGSQFKVATKGQEVTVLGTQFNVKAYNDESRIMTTLVEGKIQLKKDNFEKIIYPNQQAQIDLITNKIDIATVDVSKEIAWVKGLFSFEEAHLDQMMKTLSRWYDVDILFTSSEEKEFLFTGILERTSKIEDILTIIKQTSLDNELTFDIKDRVIIIK